MSGAVVNIRMRTDKLAVWLGDASQERHMRFRAPAPRDLEIVETLYSLVVSWAPAPCVQVNYDL